MGTRSLTVVLGNNDTELATIYRHWDGYPSAHGQDLKDWFANCEIVNGLTAGQDPSKIINGLERLASKIVARLEKAGNDPAILKTGSRERGEEYIYALSCHGNRQKYECPIGPIRLRIYAGPITAFGFGGEHCTNLIYDGLLADFDPEAEEQPND